MERAALRVGDVTLLRHSLLVRLSHLILYSMRVREAGDGRVKEAGGGRVKEAGDGRVKEAGGGRVNEWAGGRSGWVSGGKEGANGGSEPREGGRGGGRGEGGRWGKGSFRSGGSKTLVTQQVYELTCAFCDCRLGPPFLTPPFRRNERCGLPLGADAVRSTVPP